MFTTQAQGPHGKRPIKDIVDELSEAALLINHALAESDKFRGWVKTLNEEEQACLITHSHRLRQSLFYEETIVGAEKVEAMQREAVYQYAFARGCLVSWKVQLTNWHPETPALVAYKAELEAAAFAFQIWFDACDPVNRLPRGRRSSPEIKDELEQIREETVNGLKHITHLLNQHKQIAQCIQLHHVSESIEDETGRQCVQGGRTVQSTSYQALILKRQFYQSRYDMFLFEVIREAVSQLLTHVNAGKKTWHDLLGVYPRFRDAMDDWVGHACRLQPQLESYLDRIKVSSTEYYGLWTHDERLRAAKQGYGERLEKAKQEEALKFFKAEKLVCDSYAAALVDESARRYKEAITKLLPGVKAFHGSSCFHLGSLVMDGKGGGSDVTLGRYFMWLAYSLENNAERRFAILVDLINGVEIVTQSPFPAKAKNEEQLSCLRECMLTDQGVVKQLTFLKVDVAHRLFLLGECLALFITGLDTGIVSHLELVGSLEQACYFFEQAYLYQKRVCDRYDPSVVRVNDEETTQARDQADSAKRKLQQSIIDFLSMLRVFFDDIPGSPESVFERIKQSFATIDVFDKPPEWGVVDEDKAPRPASP